MIKSYTTVDIVTLVKVTYLKWCVFKMQNESSKKKKKKNDDAAKSGVCVPVYVCLQHGSWSGSGGGGLTDCERQMICRISGPKHNIRDLCYYQKCTNNFRFILILWKDKLDCTGTNMPSRHTWNTATLPFLSRIFFYSVEQSLIKV